MGFRTNDSEDDWKKPKETLKTPVQGSSLTSMGRKLKPFKLRKIRHFAHAYVFSSDLGWKTA